MFRLWKDVREVKKASISIELKNNLATVTYFLDPEFKSASVAHYEFVDTAFIPNLATSLRNKVISNHTYNLTITIKSHGNGISMNEEELTSQATSQTLYNFISTHLPKYVERQLLLPATKPSCTIL